MKNTLFLVNTLYTIPLPVIYTEHGAMSEGFNIMVRANSIIDFKHKSWMDNCVLSPHDQNNSRNSFLGMTLDLSMGSVV